MAKIRLRAFPAEYTPIPFQELAYMAEKKQQFKDKAFDLEADLESQFGKIGALDVDAPERSNIINGFRNELASVYEQSGGNPNKLLTGFKQVQRKFNKELAYGKLGGINQRYQGFAESQKELAEQGKSYLENKGDKGISPEEGGMYLQQELNVLNAEPIKQTSLGTWETYRKETRQPTLQLTKIADQIAKEMRDKPQLITQFTGLQDAGGGYYRDVVTKREYTEAQAIEKAAVARMTTDPFVQSYMSTINKISGKEAGLRDLLTAAEQQAQFDPSIYSVDGTSYNPNDPNARRIFQSKVADKVLNEDIYNAAKTAANIYQLERLDVDPTYLKKWREALMMQKKLSEPPVATPQTFETQYTEWRNMPENVWKNDSFQTDANGNMVVSTSVSDAYVRGMTPDQIRDYEARNIKQQNVLKQRYDKIREEVPALKGKSDLYVRDFMSKAYENSGASFQMVNLPNINFAEATPQLLGNVANSSFYVSTDKGVSHKGNISSSAETLGYTPQELQAIVQDQAKKGFIKIAPFSPLGKAGYAITVPSKEADGGSATVIVSSSKELTQNYSWLYPLYENLEQGKMGFSTTKILPTDVGTYTGVYDQGGQPVWYTGRVLSKDDTDKNLRGMGLTKAEAEQRGIQFTPDGNLIDPNITPFIDQSNSRWLNSSYIKPFTMTATRNPYQITDDSQDIYTTED